MDQGSVRVIGILDNNQLAYWSFRSRAAGQQNYKLAGGKRQASSLRMPLSIAIQAASFKQQATSIKLVDKRQALCYN